MRELKFRQWVEDGYLYWGWLKETHTDRVVFTGPAVDPRSGGSEVAWINAEQYTGLKDSGGNDIYEGDILQLDKTHVKAFRRVVGFREGKFGYADPVVGVWFALAGRGTSGEWKWAVVGNIHENPELVNGEKS